MESRKYNFEFAASDDHHGLEKLITKAEQRYTARDSMALAEAHAHALTIVEGVTVPTQLSFIVLAERREEPSIAAALRLIEDQWAT